MGSPPFTSSQACKRAGMRRAAGEVDGSTAHTEDLGMQRCSAAQWRVWNTGNTGCNRVVLVYFSCLCKSAG